MKRSIGLVCLLTVACLFTFPLWGDCFWYGIGYAVENCTAYWRDLLTPQGSVAAASAQPVVPPAPAVATGEPISGSVRINGESRRIYIGMAEKECYKVCGSPFKVNTTVGPWGTHEQVIFNKYDIYNPHTRQPILYFENGVLTAWQE